MKEHIQQAFVSGVCIIGAIAAIVGISLLIDFASPVQVRTSKPPDFELGKSLTSHYRQMNHYAHLSSLFHYGKKKLILSFCTGLSAKLTHPNLHNKEQSM